ncbi:MAG: putative permease, superfamily [Ilumatobacteraceae bacterium]|nr:putative permease, superfamily [Ilumatobacteraceae bacterium]
MIIGAIVSVQLGAALAATMFDTVGSSGMVLLRLGFAAIVLLGISRPKLAGRTRRDWTVTVAFGVLLATMNLTFYAAVARLPLGLAVTLELLGPLGLAVAMSRRLRELAWTALAIIGVVMLGESGHHIDRVGVVFALVAAACWAGYILLNAETGRRSSGTDGLALAITVGALVAAPIGIASGGMTLLRPTTLLAGAGVAMLSSVINFCLELAALRTVAARPFGVLMSLSPVAATLAGFVVLGQRLGVLQIVAIGCVIAASVGTIYAKAAPSAGKRAAGS